MSNLPIEIKKDNIFKKVIKFIKNFFKKEEIIENEISNEVSNALPKRKINHLYKIDGFGNINISNKNNKKQKMKEIINIIEENPAVLEKLDIRRLKIIDIYYVKKIEECKKKLANIVNNN